MATSVFKNLFYDPRKILLTEFAISLLVMVLGIMDYEFQKFHYIVILVLMVSQLPLLMLGGLNLNIKIDLSDKIGWAFFALAVLLVGYNIYLNGIPYLMGNLVAGEALNQAKGDYYHEKYKLTFILWPLLTIMIPMSLLISGKILKFILFSFPIISSVLIQIKAPFIFGFIYYFIFFQITGRKIKVSSLLIVFFLSLILFLAINSTRTAEELDIVADLLGVSKNWQWIGPLFWFPLSYVGGSVVNGFHLLPNKLFGFDLSQFVLILPSSFLSDDLQNQILNFNYTLPWEVNNNASAVAGFSSIFGIIGTFIFVFLVSLFLFYIAKKKLFGSTLLLSIFIVAMKNVGLFIIANYFIHPTILGEFVLVYFCLHFSKIKIHSLA